MRSLVPKEKKSAASAIRCAVSAARGSSIIVPIGTSRSTPASAHSCLISRRTRRAPGAAPSPNPTSGTMISTFGCLPALHLGDRRLGDRPDLQREQARAWSGRAGRRADPASGWTRAAAPPRRAASGRRRPRPGAPLASASATLTDSSVRSGRNSCSGGSSSRMLTGSPSIASSSSMKSLRCNGNSASSAASRSSTVPARMTRSISVAAVAEEHVLGAAQPDALARRACAPGRRPRRCRRWPAPPAAAGGRRG